MRHKLIRTAQWLFALAVLGFAGVGLIRQWTHVRDRLSTLDIHWSRIAVASILVLGAYAILIEVWRRMLEAWDNTLGWLPTTRIWFASSLAKYIPGNVWSVAALGVMAKEQGISGVAAVGSSIMVTLLNLVSGLAVVLFCGSKLVEHFAVFAGAAAVIITATVLAPTVFPGLAKWLCRVTGKDVRLPTVPPGLIWLSLTGTAVAWLAYGVAFRFFAQGMLGAGRTGAAPFLPYIAVYTGAYILGFVTPVAPAGLGVREAGIVAGLVGLGLMERSDAVIVALTSRLWITILEVAPGLIALAASQARTRTHHA